MKLMFVSLLCLGISTASFAKIQPKSVHSFSTQSLKGQKLDLAQYKGKVLLLVNTASECGYTGQYEDLEKLYGKYKEQGLVVIGFPSNDFGGQEPGSNQEIAQFCQRNYGVTFPMSEKVVVLGEKKAPLYQYLTQMAPEKGEVSWNFEKFIVDKNGQVVARYKSKVKPMDSELTQKIESLLK